MITWIQRILTRHYKWMFVLLILCVALPFIFNVGASPGITSDDKSAGRQMYFGLNLNDPRDVQPLLRDASISHYMDTGQAIMSERQANELSLPRPALLKLAEELMIGKPNDAELVEYIKTKTAFKGEDGKFSQEAYEKFIELINSDPETTEDHIREVLSEDYQIDEVVRALAGPGYVQPFEAVHAVERSETKWSVEVATLDYNDVEKSIIVNDDELNKYFELHKNSYKTEPKVRASYVVFESKNYKGESGSKQASEAASDFLFKIYEKDVKYKSDEFNELLKKYNLRLKDLPAYTRTSYIDNAPLPVSLLDEVFTLNKDHYYTDIVETKDGTAIGFFNELTPAVQLSLKDIEERVKTDYLATQRVKMAEVKSVTMKTNIESALKKGTKFAEAAKKESLGITAYKDFKITEAPEGIRNNAILLKMLNLKQDQMSDLIQTDEKAYLVYVTKKDIPSIPEDDERVQNVLKGLENMTSVGRAKSFINELMTRELKKNL